MRIIMIAKPGAGKSTQGKILSSRLSVPHISTGDIFRQHIKDNTELGQKIKETMDSGDLVDESVVSQIVTERLRQKDAKHGFILDGYPRFFEQATHLSTITTIDMAIYIDITDGKAIERIGGRRVCFDCGDVYNLTFRPPKTDNICDKCRGKLYLRNEDAVEAVENRLKDYYTYTQPLIGYYLESGAYRWVNGMLSTSNKITNEIAKLF